MPLRVKPAVAIGLGGTGKEVVMRVRRMMVERFGSLEEFPIVQFVIIDTDPSDEVSFEAREIEDKIRPMPSERVHAAVPDVYQLWREMEKLPHLKEWVPEGLEETAGESITHGAKQCRPLGRLSFFFNYSNIRKAIAHAYSRARDHASREKVSQKGIEVVGLEPDFYIVCSVCGGTGSGMLLDTAYLIRDIVGREKESPVVAYLILPNVFDDCDVGRLYPNSYATLMEVDYLLKPKTRFSVQYAEGEPPLSFEGAPFKAVYLVGNANERVVFDPRESRPDFYEMVAHHLFLEITPNELVERARAVRDNWVQLQRFDDFGFPLRYLSFGLSCVEFPAERVKMACTYRLALAIVNHWLGEGRPEVEDSALRREVEQFVDQQGLMETERRHDLLERIAQPALEHIQAWRRRIASLAQHVPFGTLSQRLIGEYDSVALQLRPQGEVARKMEVNAEALRASVKEEVRKRVEAMLHEGAGPSTASRWLQALTKYLTEVEGRLRREIAERGEAQVRAEKLDRMARTRVEGVGECTRSLLLNLFGKRRVVVAESLRWAGIASRALMALAGITARRMAVRLLEGLLGDLSTLRGEVEKLRDRLSERRMELEEGREKAEEAVARTIVNGELLWPREPEESRRELENYYERVVRLTGQPDDEERTVRELSEALLEGESPLALLKRPEKLKRGLWEICSQRVEERLGEISAAHYLAPRPDDEVERILRNAADKAQPYLPLKSQAAMRGLPSDAQRELSIVGLEGGAQPKTEEATRIVNLLQNRLGYHGADLCAIRDKHQIIFLRQIGALPLRAVSDVEVWRERYRHYLASPRHIPLHIHKDFPALLPDLIETEEEREKARRAVVQALALGVIQERADGRLVYEFVDERGFRDARILAEERDLLRAAVVLASDPSLLERLRNSIGEAKGKMSREELTQRCRAFLEKVLEECGGDASSERYQMAKRGIDELLGGGGA